jgi:hypothetical protein
MDLALYFRVLWRFRTLVVLGLLMAIVLTFFSFAKVNFKDGFRVTYRQSETWRADANLLVTQRGFPWGRTVYPSSAKKVGEQEVVVSPFADTGRFTSLALFYSTLANGDAVRALIRKGGPLRGTYAAQPVQDDTPQRSTTPFMSISGFSNTPERAKRLAARASVAFLNYIEQQQRAADIAPRDRVQIQVVNRPSKAKLEQGRRLTVPIIVFLTVMIATIGLAFILENLRPRVRRVAAPSSESDVPASELKSA